MTTSIRLLGWEATGLRVPDHKVSFRKSEDDVWPVSLLQMPNGTGKTTTLNLIRATLSGELADRGLWQPARVRQLRKRENDSGIGSFRVDILVDKRRLTLIAEFDFEDGEVAFKTTYGSGQKVGFHPPLQARRFLRPGFVNFFAFDGELAEHLLSHDHTNAESAIEDLFQLGVFRNIELALQEFWEKKTERRAATEVRGLSRRRTRVQKLTTLLARRRTEYAAAMHARGHAEAELQKYRRRFEKKISENQQAAEELQGLERDFQKAEQSVREVCRSLLLKARFPNALDSGFAGMIVDLKDNLDRVKLPESAAREFFEELASEDTCVCGRPMDSAARASLLARASSYLGSDEVSVINALKTDIQQFIGGRPADAGLEAQEAIKSLLAAIRFRQEKKNALDMGTTRATLANPELEAVQKKIEHLNLDYEKARNDVDAYEDLDDSRNDEDTKGIKILEKRFKDAQEKLAEITDTLDLKRRKDALSEVLDTAYASARAQLVSLVVDQANGRISSLMPYNQIRIRGINRSLQLHDQEGGSVGETLCLAYAFLATLFSHTNHELPFVVDSPAGSIDLAVRRQVAALIPQLSHQFIAFTISSERQDFLDPLRSAVDGGVQHLTLFRKTVGNVGVAPHRSDTTYEFSDGVLVDGAEFFEGFHLDAEG